MTCPYKFLAHKVFVKQVEEFKKRNPSYFKSLLHKCRQSLLHPFDTGGLLIKGAPLDLQGKIYKVWVSGGDKFRYIYFVSREDRCVCGVFISSERRAKIDYDVIPWIRYAQEIYNDLISGNKDQFEVWNFE